ncbi:vWA domain-containing protein [Gemmatimonas sp.]|uniref:vWA domain-containing protein n=1 Tax=Gemmatimonas sp. TaxID=1962908 RepID=UPI003F72F7A7
MGFLVPAFLAAMAALAVPLLLHLRHRDRDKPQLFPSLMFLEKLTIRTEQRQRVSDWPLLLMRLAALALLVFAFSRPLFRSQRARAGDARSRAVVLLVDRSLSMGYEGTWARALDSARAVIATLGNNDRVAVVAYDDMAETRQRLTTDKAAAVASLASLSPRARGTRLAPALRVARQQLLDAPFAAAQIVVISDLQRAGAVGVAGVELPTGVSVRGIVVGPERWENSTVHAIDARRVVSGERTLLAVKARLQRHGGTAPQERTVRLVLNGREAATQQVTLAPTGETVVTFAPVPAPEGAVAVQLSLSPDALAADDTLVAVVPRDDDLRVTLINGGAETLFFERALDIGRAPSVQLTRDASAAAPSARTGVMVYWDAVPGSTITPWLEAGGGAVVVVGRRLGARRGSLSPLIPATVAGSADRLSDRGGTLRDVRTEHPLFAPFREVPDALGAVRLFRYARLDAASEGAVLARFDDGLPAVVERRVGQGRVLLLALPLDNDAGDFPLQPAFLPFVRQLVMHASGRDATPLWRTTGERWALSRAIASPVVEAPDGTLIRPVADSQGTAIPLTDAGVYRAYAERVGGDAVSLLAVNVPTSESVLTPMDTAELLLGVQTGANRSGRSADAPQSDEELERRQSPWRLLLLAALLLLVLETFVATRGRRGTARRIVSQARCQS